jgi:ankyrin repeat protein
MSDVTVKKKKKKSQIGIHEAVALGNFAELRKLVQHDKKKNNGVSLIVNSLDSESATPVHIACRCRRKEILEYLLSEHANPMVRDQGHYTPLHMACLEEGNEEIIRILLAQPSVDVNAHNSRSTTPFHYFCRTYTQPEHYKTFLKFIERGVDVNALNKVPPI